MSESDTDPALSDLGPKPDAETEPGEINPGGADAVEHPDGATAADGADGDDGDVEPVTRDLDPEKNPATGEMPLEVREGEDTSTEATEGDGDTGDDSDDDGDGVATEDEAPV